MTRFCLLQDDDSHWYLCPVDRRPDANSYFAEVQAYWDSDPGEGDDGPPIEPSWLRSIDSPTELTFTDPKE